MKRPAAAPHSSGSPPKATRASPPDAPDVKVLASPVGRDREAEVEATAVPAASTGTPSDVRTTLLNVLAPVREGLLGEYAEQRAALGRIAEALMGEWELCIGGEPHRICELEVYVHSSHHADPYTHGDDGQLCSANWYFHKHGGSFKAGSFKGMDLACGSRDGNVHAGLLIRAIQHCANDTIVEGPSLVVDKILALSGKKSIAELVAGREPQDLPSDSTPELRLTPKTQSVGRTWPGSRVGLVLRAEGGGATHSEGSPAAYCTRAYRFSTMPSKLSKWRSGFAAVAHLDVNGDAVPALNLPKKLLETYLAAADEGLASGDPASMVDAKISTQAELCRLIGLCEGLRRTSSQSASS